MTPSEGFESLIERSEFIACDRIDLGQHDRHDFVSACALDLQTGLVFGLDLRSSARLGDDRLVVASLSGEKASIVASATTASEVEALIRGLGERGGRAGAVAPAPAKNASRLRPQR